MNGINPGVSNNPTVVERQLFAQHFGPLHSAKAAIEDDDSFGAHSWRGKQLTSTGKSVTTDKLLARRALRWKWLNFKPSRSHAETGTGEAKAAGRHRAQ